MDNEREANRRVEVIILEERQRELAATEFNAVVADDDALFGPDANEFPTLPDGFPQDAFEDTRIIIPGTPGPKFADVFAADDAMFAPDDQPVDDAAAGDMIGQGDMTPDAGTGLDFAGFDLTPDVFL